MPDGRVQVHAPPGSDPDTVVQAVRKRSRWIWQQVVAWQARRAHVLPREYVSGESHFYLGRRYRLKVSVAKVGEPSVKLLRGQLEVIAPDKKAQTVRRLLDVWYKVRAREVFQRRLAICIEQARWLKEPPSIRLLAMKTQWGSCSPDGKLILNPALIKAPTICIDYVICHELCHIREHNHSEDFYNLLTGLVPDWMTRKQELDHMADVILNQ